MLNSSLTITSKGMSFTSLGTGGSYKHTLSMAEMPRHRHTIVPLWVAGGGATAPEGQNRMVGGYPTVTNKGEYGRDTDYIGSSSAHNNVMPYISVYFWRRTA